MSSMANFNKPQSVPSFITYDAVRDHLRSQGYALEDHPQGRDYSITLKTRNEFCELAREVGQVLRKQTDLNDHSSWQYVTLVAESGAGKTTFAYAASSAFLGKTLRYPIRMLRMLEKSCFSKVETHQDRGIIIWDRCAHEAGMAHDRPDVNRPKRAIFVEHPLKCHNAVADLVIHLSQGRRKAHRVTFIKPLKVESLSRQ